MSMQANREEAASTEVISEETGSANAAAPTTSNPTLRLRLTKTKKESNRRVSWTADTVDNEFMNKKKSKCCCQYHKPKMWDESTDEDENYEECDHCKGHRKSDYNSKRDKENCRHKSVDEGTSSSHCHDNHDH